MTTATLDAPTHEPDAHEPDAPALTITPEFLRAGRAVFTVENPEGEHYTYRLTRSADEPDAKRPACWFASLLTGPDNERDYTYIGLYCPDRADVRLTSKSRLADDSRAVRVLRWAVQIVHGLRPLPAGYQIRHEGRCGRCARVLTTPDSLTSGLGPECRRAVRKGF